jgi:hypothetical protein
VGKVRISRNPLAFRARAKPIEVVLDESDPRAGAVGITVCEIPKGLLEEIRDDVDDLVEEIKGLNSQIADARLRGLAVEELAAAKARGASFEELAAIKTSARAAVVGQIEELKKEKAKRRRELVARQRDLVAWGVCDHKAEDFLDDETGEAFPFDAERGEYDGVAYKVASPVLIAAYLSAGEPFFKALYNAIVRWQQGVAWSPAKVWEEHKAAQERIKALVKAQLEAELKAKGLDVEIPAEALEEVDEIGGPGGGAPAPLSGDPEEGTATPPAVEESPARSSTTSPN